ncbi:MAG TPA: DUF4142 domain-containing protein [Polyangiaceae bacterium]|nr:DUF4142 domain-containing protein [Polyangiaceae bacterium]
MSKTIVLTSVLALGALHCGGSSSRGSNMPEGAAAQEEGPGETMASAGMGPGDTQGSGTDTEMTPNSQPSAPANALSDPEIAMITEQANTAEIEQARVAQSKSQNDEVRRFAQMMIEHHTRAKSDQQALGLSTAESPLSRQLEQKAMTTLETLKSTSGADFDRAYIDAQVEGHQEVLDTIRQLQPNAQSSGLRSYLDDLTPKVEQHLEQARAAQQALRASSSRSGATGMR